MSRLSDRLQQVLDQLGSTASALERSAELPAMTIAHMLRGVHPRSERFSKLLAVIPEPAAHDLLVAYLLDDCPERWVPHVQIRMKGSPNEAATELPLNGNDTVGRTPATQARRVLDEMRSAIDSGDTELAKWLATTGQLFIGRKVFNSHGQAA